MHGSAIFAEDGSARASDSRGGNFDLGIYFAHNRECPRFLSRRWQPLLHSSPEPWVRLSPGFKLA